MPGRYPPDGLSGFVFPPAVQARGMTGSVYWGDAGDGERPLNPSLSYNRNNAGQDTVFNGASGRQWDDAWGMADARDSFRSRFLCTLNLGKLIRPNRAKLDGTSDMRPSAIAVHPRSFGEVQPAVSRRPGGRMVAPGRVTRWDQASLIWPNFGRQ